MNDWVGVDPLGSAAEAGGVGGGRGLLTIGAGGVNGRGCSEKTCTAAKDLLGAWFWARESCKGSEIVKNR